ncbi:MAG TPA: DNA repair protein RadA, partial [Chloroflexi bacterium]|nr:DNA repair protein RadA [Chloroflexota bacterium]
MSREKVIYVCQSCGASFPKWMGRCPQCGEWNTLVETVPEVKRKSAVGPVTPSGEPMPITAVSAEDITRIPVSIEELSRVLGGGIVPGSVVLIGGEPGIGKSTLLLQLASLLARQQPDPVLYVSGEESARQIRMRADRLGVREDNLYVLAETSLEQIMAHIERMGPFVVMVDSIQSIYSEALESTPGSVVQVRECAYRLLRIAKSTGTPVFLVGHVTKAGAIAGPKVLEHAVDAVLYLEGDRFHSYRVLRSVKNRFGATSEVGIFEMGEEGLKEVPNPSEIFLSERVPNASGSAIAITMEGTRPLLVEIQALTSPTSFAIPRRTANGIDINRLLLLIAVLSKRVGLRLSDQDIFVNVVGGMRIREPAVDLAVAVAVAS